MAENRKPLVLVTSCEYPEAGLKILQDECRIIQTESNGHIDKVKVREEIENLISGVDGIVWCAHAHLDKSLLDKAGSQLKVVSAMSAGVDHIDVTELKKRNILISNTPDVLNAAVADVAILHMISSARRVNERIQEVKIGKWELGPQRMLGVDIKGSTVGIIGLGGIGRMIAKRLTGFEIEKILYCGHKPKPTAKEIGAEFVTFDELLARSDFVILSCPLNETTKNLMNSEAFSKMKKNAILINISRGGVIDQDALYNALKNKQIYAAGLDVTVPEPLPKDHPLITLPNCFITPHLGSATEQTRQSMAALSAKNLLLGLRGETLLTPVK